MKNSDLSWIRMFLKIKNHFFIACLTLTYGFVLAQKEKQFNSLSTCIVLEPTMSIELARNRAIQALKVKSLQEAGVAELITSNQYLEVNNNDIEKDIFYESTFSDLRGEISSFQLINFSQSIGDGGEILICVSAKVSVIKYKDLDRDGPKLLVSGILNRYKTNENINLNISANQDSYIWIFLIDNEENYSLLYPTNPNVNNFIRKNNTLLLPDSDVYWQVNSRSEEEKNAFLIVGHDKNIPINSKKISNFNDWATWYKSLDYKKKTKQIFNFIIYNQ